MVEPSEHANHRGAKALAAVLGVGLAGDARHMTAPHPDGRGAAAAMRAALADAGVHAEQIDMVSVHGTGTVFNDQMEAKALRSVFSDRPVAFHGVKQAIGHTLGATGAIEATVVVDALGSGHHPPHPQHIAETLGLEVPDAAGPPTIALSTNSAFGGANASVVLARPGAVAPRKQSPRPVGTVEGPEVRVPPGRVDWKALWPDAPERFLRFDRYVRLGMLALARLFEKVPPTLETGIVLASPSGCRA
ncbi:MAG: hypothetical protein JRI25_27270, partial [Deltaproteobacteria bacterium]|nr:hypothetical protein [Deltaproteobacteria bacterium]